jgi:hypothetical protein
MISEPTPRPQSLLSAVPQMSSVSSEFQLATLAGAARDAIQSPRAARFDDEAVRYRIDEGGASGSAPGGKSSPRVAQRGTLQRAVAEYTRQMKNLGQFPEKVLVAVKSTVRDVATPMISKSVLDTLVCDAAQWSIAAYFDTSSEEDKA